MTKVELTLLERLRRGFQLSGFTAFSRGSISRTRCGVTLWLGRSGLLANPNDRHEFAHCRASVRDPQLPLIRPAITVAISARPRPATTYCPYRRVRDLRPTMAPRMQRELLSGAATADALKAGQSVIGQDVLPPLCAHVRHRGSGLPIPKAVVRSALAGHGLIQHF